MSKAFIKVIFSVLLVFMVSCNSKVSNQLSKDEKIDSLTADPTNLSKGTVVFENDTIVIYKIDSAEYFEAKNTAKHSKDTLEYIEDFSRVKKLLSGKVTFGCWNSDNNNVDSALEGGMIVKMIAGSGEVFDFTKESLQLFDVNFSRYYPSEHILLMEGGHSSDYSIDIRQGILDEWVGNPDYIKFSPTKAYRLNGWFPGQECSSYFLQKKRGDSYIYLAELPMHLTKEGFDLCTLAAEFWKDDHELYFRNTYFGNDMDERFGYFKLIIK